MNSFVVGFFRKFHKSYIADLCREQDLEQATKVVERCWAQHFAKAPSGVVVDKDFPSRAGHRLCYLFTALFPTIIDMFDIFTCFYYTILQYSTLFSARFQQHSKVLGQGGQPCTIRLYQGLKIPASKLQWRKVSAESSKSVGTLASKTSKDQLVQKLCKKNRDGQFKRGFKRGFDMFDANQHLLIDRHDARSDARSQPGKTQQLGG